MLPQRIAAGAGLSNAVRILQCNIAAARMHRSTLRTPPARGIRRCRARLSSRPEHLHDLEDAGRGERAGQRGAQRLRHRAELDALLLGEIAQSRLRGVSAAIRVADSARSAPSAPSSRARLRRQRLGGVGGEPDRPRRDIEAGLLGQLDDRLGARLEPGHRLRRRSRSVSRQRPAELLLEPLGDEARRAARRRPRGCNAR